MNEKNNTAGLHYAIKALKASYNNSVEDRKNINHNLHEGTIWSYSVVTGLAIIGLIVIMVSFIAQLTYRRQKNTFKDLVKSGIGNVTISTKTSEFVEEFEKLDNPTKQALTVTMALPPETRKERLLEALGEMAKKENTTIDMSNIPEVAINYFGTKDLRETSKKCQ